MSSKSTSEYTSPSDNSSNTYTDSEINESYITDTVRCEGCEIFYCECCKLIKQELIDKFCKCNGQSKNHIIYNDDSTDMEIEY